jgi:hypothetical protein
MNLKLTVAAGLLAAVSGVVLAQGTINTNNFVNNTKASNTKASQSYFTPAANKTAQKKGWQFSYNGSISYGKMDFGGSAGVGSGSVDITPLSLGGTVTNGGFYAAYLGQYTYSHSGETGGSEWDSGSYANLGFVKKLSKNSMMLAANVNYSKVDDSPYENSLMAFNSGDTTFSVAGAWHGLGLIYNADLSESDSNSYSLFYMKNMGKNYFKLQAGFDSSDTPSLDNGVFIFNYSYNFRSDYRIGVQYVGLRAKGSGETFNYNQYNLVLTKGLDFNGVTNAMRHYM